MWHSKFFFSFFHVSEGIVFDRAVFFYTFSEVHVNLVGFEMLFKVCFILILNLYSTFIAIFIIMTKLLPISTFLFQQFALQIVIQLHIDVLGTTYFTVIVQLCET